MKPKYPKIVLHDQVKHSTLNLKLEDKWLDYYTKSFSKRFIAFWNKVKYSNKFSYRLNHLKIQKLTFEKKLRILNLIRDRYMKIKENKIETKLTLPFYNFTRTNLEGLMPSIFYQWQTSVFSFNKKHKNTWNIDLIFTKKLLTTFFSIKNVYSINYWNWERINKLFLIDPKSQFAAKFKTFIKVTTIRTSSFYFDLSVIPKHVLRFRWVKNSFDLVNNVKEAISKRDGNIFTFHVYREFFLSYFRRPFLSIPRFKHTVSNVIIDLFIYNNKQYKLFKLMHIITRRGMYKYMYSMYANYSQKIQETISRPRFFYLNLIYPNISFHFAKVIKLYQETLIKKNRSSIFNILLLLLISKAEGQGNQRWTMEKDFRTQWARKSKINDDVKNGKRKYMRSTYFDNYNGAIFYSDKYTQKVNESQNFVIPLKSPNFRYSVRAFKFYFKELENKYNTVFDESKLTLWSKKGLKKSKNLQTKNKIRTRNFGRDKFSLKAFKRKNLLNFRTKRSISPKLANEKLISYFKYSKYQKLSSIPNNKFFIDESGKPLPWNNVKDKLLNRYKRTRKQQRQQTNFSLNNKYLNKLITLNTKASINNKDKNKFSKSNFTNLSSLSPQGSRRENSKEKKRYYYINNNINKATKNVNRTKATQQRENNNKDNYNNDKFINIKDKYITFNNNKKNNNKNRSSLNSTNNNISTKYNNYSNTINYNGKNKDNNMDIYNSNNKNKNNKCRNNNNKFINTDTKKKYHSKAGIKKIQIQKLNRLSFTFDFHGRRPWKSSGENIREILNLRLENPIFQGRNQQNSLENWDNLDQSLLKTLNILFKFPGGFKEGNDNNSFRIIYEKGIGNLSTKDYWYSIYYLSYLRTEYDKLSRDILMSKEINYYPKSNYKYNTEYSDIGVEIVEYKNNYNKRRININIHKDYNMLGIKARVFNDKIFKPYFRYMLDFFIYKRYKYLLSKSGQIIWWLDTLNIIPKKTFFGKVLNNSVLYDFVIVRTVFDLMKYNYRSLLRGSVTSELYYIDKIKYFKSEFHTTSILTFLSSMLFIRHREKAPDRFWWTYDKEIGNYFNRIKQYVNLSQKTQVLLPFTFYFEDILYSIYGKWGLVRLWPLKKKMLSSTILAQLISEVTNTDSNRYVTRYDFNFRDVLGRVRKYINYSGNETKKWYKNKVVTSWPKDLLKHEGISKFIKLNKYDRKLGMMENLVTYQNATNQFWMDPYGQVNKDFMKGWKGRVNISENELISIPLRRYIGYIKNNSDVVAYRSSIKGRTPKPGKAIRAEYYMYEHGNLTMPMYWDKEFKIRSHSLRRYRTTFYSDRSYAKHTFLNRNGILTLRLWLYSRLNIDIRDTLYYISSIRELYTNMINREYEIQYLPKPANLKSKI